MPETPRLKIWLERLGFAAPYATYLPIALLLCAPVVLRQGWPQSHEQLAPFERVECFRRAFASGIWLPTWSPYPFAGFGSPFPLLYHRLFSTLGGAIALVTGNSVTAVRLLIPALLVTGALGVYRLCREAEVSRSLSWAAGVVLMASPYTIIDWLVRGAVAEFTAAMLFPWWLGAVLGFSRGTRRWVRLAFLTGLLFHAHSVLCLFALPLALGLFVSAIFTRALTWQNLKLEWRRIAVGALLLFACVLPFLLAISRVIPSVNTEWFKQFTSPAKEFRPFSAYIVDEGFAWGSVYRGVSVELNRYVVVGLLAFGFGAACLQLKLRKSTTRFLLAALASCLFLQLPASNWIYAHVPGAFYLQFPWRLNAFMTPILIVLMCVAGESCAASSKSARLWVHIGAAACLLSSLDFSVRALRLDYGRFSASEMSASIASLADDVAGVEYLPAGVTFPQPGPAPRRRRHAAAVLEASWPSRPLISSDCVRSWPTNFATRTLSLDIFSDRECHVDIRQFRLPPLELDLENASLLPGAPEAGFQILVHPGNAHLRLRQKSVMRLAAEFFSKH